jgi:predicted ATP-grasp superfamily ATP-dependent carboligase
MEMIKVLITSSGTSGGFWSSKFLREHYGQRVKIYQIDINPKNLVSSSIFSDFYFKCPRVDDLDYENFITDFINENNIDIVIPFIDKDIFILSHLYEKKKIGANVKLQINSTEFAIICLDKYFAYEWMLGNNINTPFTFLLNENVEQKKYVIKPISGFGSLIQILEASEIEKLEEKSRFIGQDICNKPEITVDVFYQHQKNDFYYICRERIEVKGGVCTKARLFVDSEIEQLAIKIAMGLKLSYFCFQIMKYNGSWAVTDINPRLGAGTSMGIEVGMDFYGAMCCDILKEDYQGFISQFTGEAYVTRQYLNIRTNG